MEENSSKRTSFDGDRKKNPDLSSLREENMNYIE
jgi:hypothetical protein